MHILHWCKLSLMEQLKFKHTSGLGNPLFAGRVRLQAVSDNVTNPCLPDNKWTLLALA